MEKKVGSSCDHTSTWRSVEDRESIRVKYASIESRNVTTFSSSSNCSSSSWFSEVRALSWSSISIDTSVDQTPSTCSRARLWSLHCAMKRSVLELETLRFNREGKIIIKIYKILCFSFKWKIKFIFMVFHLIIFFVKVKYYIITKICNMEVKKQAILGW